MKTWLLAAFGAVTAFGASGTPFVIVDHRDSDGDAETMRAFATVNARHTGSADAFLVNERFRGIQSKLAPALLTGCIRIETEDAAVPSEAVRLSFSEDGDAGKLLCDLASGLASGKRTIAVTWKRSGEKNPVMRYEEFATALSEWRPYLEKVAAVSRTTEAGGAGCLSLREGRDGLLKAFSRVDANGQVRAVTFRNVSGGTIPVTRLVIGKAAPGRALWQTPGVKPVELPLTACGQGNGVAIRLPAFAGATVGTLFFETDELWRQVVTPPEKYTDFLRIVEKQKKTYDLGDFTVEYYDQSNGPDVYQTLIMAIPKGAKGKFPAVVVPYYFPEAMLAFDPKTGKELSSYKEVAYMADLARRGYVTICGQAFHLTYAKKGLPENDWDKWVHAAAVLNRDWPDWTGVGKLVFDTRLLIDLVAADERVDSERIGIIGHSLGGKMAFYTGCLDSRIKAIVASDFGLGWQQTNWQDPWYWGDKFDAVVKSGFENADLLAATGGTPICIIAGKADDALTGEIVRRLPSYAKDPSRFLLINHGTGHRPPQTATEEGYRFLDSVLKK